MYTSTDAWGQLNRSASLEALAGLFYLKSLYEPTDDPISCYYLLMSVPPPLNIPLSRIAEANTSAFLYFPPHPRV